MGSDSDRDVIYETQTVYETEIVSPQEIYLVIKERGEYSQWTKENLLYFPSYEEATEYIQFQEKLHSLNRNRDLSISYSVEKIPLGSNITHSEQAIQEARDKAEKSLEEEEKEYKLRRAEFEEEENIRKEKQKKDIYDFLNWWDGGITNDSFFESKRFARVRSIYDEIFAFIKETNDTRASKWVIDNEDWLLKVKEQSMSVTMRDEFEKFNRKPSFLSGYDTSGYYGPASIKN